MEQRLSIITLGCRDVERAKALYEALGWRPGMVAPVESVKVKSPVSIRIRPETVWNSSETASLGPPTTVTCPGGTARSSAPAGPGIPSA